MQTVKGNGSNGSAALESAEGRATVKSEPQPATPTKYLPVSRDDLKNLLKYMVLADAAYTDCVRLPIDPKKQKAAEDDGVLGKIYKYFQKTKPVTEEPEFDAKLEQADATYPGLNLSKQIVGKELLTDFDNTMYKGIVVTITTNAQANVLLLKTGEIIIAFRGTEGLSADGRHDWVADLSAKPVSVAQNMDGAPENFDADFGAAKPMVHWGFLTYFNALAAEETGENDIKNAISRLLAENPTIPLTKITCVGHSLGGAMAVLGAYWCKRFKYPEVPVFCYTYGAPRVGDEAFANDFDACIENASLRCVHKDDPVPSVPIPLSLLSLEQAGWGYIHTHRGNESGADTAKTIMLCQPLKGFHYTLGEAAKKACNKVTDQYVAAFLHRPYRKPAMISDHMQPQYLHALCSALGGKYADAVPDIPEAPAMAPQLEVFAAQADDKNFNVLEKPASP